MPILPDRKHQILRIGSWSDDLRHNYSWWVIPLRGSSANQSSIQTASIFIFLYTRYGGYWCWYYPKVVEYGPCPTPQLTGFPSKCQDPCVTGRAMMAKCEKSLWNQKLTPWKMSVFEKNSNKTKFTLNPILPSTSRGKRPIEAEILSLLNFNNS